MAISEQSVVDATLMAIEELNAQGGVLGNQIEPILIDGKSDWPTFAKGAQALIQDHQVSVIFGCWTSASRKMVKPVVEKLDSLLFYPVQYEGLESSPNIIYTGAAPNQQITPAVKWSVDNIGKRVFLAASDYVFPRAANTLIHKQIHALDAEVVGEYYIPLGHKNVDAMIDAIALSQPDVILNTINGDSNLTFFRELSQRGIETPVMSFSIAEDELQHLDLKTMVGHYSAWNYFQSLNTPENRRFVTRFKQAYGKSRTTNASMEAGYLGVYLWAKAVQQARTTESTSVREALKGATLDSPEGNVFISGINNHLWKPFYIGQIQPNGQFSIIWRQPKPIRPLPFPAYRSVSSWQKYLRTMYQSWDKSWAAPPLTAGAEI
ncbi:urea ABC transporter substrate-binding protein [Gammaproteobacteria bacterium 45_16_T64]|nr:urea ABC transporter substrate-binding protein [Gammaproteobacteria bacterium 45_16_T64]